MATFGAVHDVLHSESLAGQSRAMVRTRTATAHRDATDLGLAVDQTSIQQLVVAMSRSAAAGSPATATVPTDLEGISR